MSGVSFDEASEHCVHGTLGGQRVPFIGIAPLIQNKRASGRPQDLADADALEKLRPR